MNVRRIVGVLAAASISLLANSPADAATRARSLAESIFQDSQVRLSAGPNHTCHVKDDGTVRCWGLNDDGQLGDGTIVNRQSPVTVSGVFNAVGVAAGASHTCAVLADGRVWCWGDNSSGQLGDGTNVSRLTARIVSFVTNAVAVAAGGAHTCALLAHGSVSCWGRHPSGQHVLTPSTVGGLAGAVSITAAGAHTCVILVDTGLWCWGDNSFSQLGFHPSFARQFEPEPVPAGLGGVVAVAAGLNHTCAIARRGTVVCWGDNSAGQLGFGFTSGPASISDVSSAPAPVTNAIAIAAGASHSCAIVAAGTSALQPGTITRCWGFNGTGQLGDGTSTDRTAPVAVSGLVNAVAITAGTSLAGHSCALLADGGMRCWGRNVFGQLGTGHTSDALAPATVAGGGGSVLARAIAVGGNHTCAVRGNGTVSCWGDNGTGQLGDGTIVRRLSPVAVSGLTHVVGIAAGELHTCAILANGTAKCWGLNGNGQLGDGTLTNRLAPVAVSGLSGVVALAAGGDHTCALTVQSDVFCWGFNGSGQLGDGTTTRRLTPVKIGSFQARAIATGISHSCAIEDDTGVPFCWGSNSSGQLGDGTTTTRPVPTPLSFFDDIVAIAAGDSHSCALLADGSSRCWGSIAGQLVANSIVIAAGTGHSCAVVADGSARCWGDNTNGQLGDGTTTDRPFPALVTVLVFRRTVGGGGSLVPVSFGQMTQIAAGRRHTCAARANGAVHCWGDNFFGQLGDGTTAGKTRPVAVPSFTLNIDPLVTLRANSRIATVHVLATCEEGQQLHVDVTLTQGAVQSLGTAVGQCTGALERYRVIVPARGRSPFIDGGALVEAEAVFRDDGVIVDTQQWTRQVTIVREQ